MTSLGHVKARPVMSWTERYFLSWALQSHSTCHAKDKSLIHYFRCFIVGSTSLFLSHYFPREISSLGGRTILVLLRVLVPLLADPKAESLTPAHTP